MAEDYDEFAYMDDDDDDRITRFMVWVAVALGLAIPLVAGLAIYGAVRLIWG